MFPGPPASLLPPMIKSPTLAGEQATPRSALGGRTLASVSSSGSSSIQAYSLQAAREEGIGEAPAAGQGKRGWAGQASGREREG